MSDSKNNNEHLIDAYNRMLERTRKAMDEMREETLPSMVHFVEVARDKAVEMGELTREEAQKVSDYIRRDIQDAAHYIDENKEELGAWFRFDVSLIEERIADMFAVMVDHTRTELDKLAKTAEAVGWHTGEIVGPGTLECSSCGQHLHFHKTGHIPPCPKCKATQFKRVRDTE